MIRRFLLLGAFAAVLMVSPGVVGGVREGHAQQPVTTLSLVLERPNGTTFELLFLVRADGPSQAREAAAAALRGLAPGARVAEDRPGTVSAQFAPWGWKWDDNEIAVPVAYNPAGEPDGFGPEDVVAALGEWGAVRTSRFAFAYSGLSEAPASLQDGETDGLNVVAWMSLGCDHGCVLGVTSKEAVHEADIVLNSNPEARLGDGRPGTYDARSVLLHEAGHLAGLDHSCPALVGPCTEANLEAVMFYRYQGTKRTLQPDDVAGISALYPRADEEALPVLPTEAPNLPPTELAVALTAGWNLTVLPPGPVDSAVQALPCVEAVYRYSAGGWDYWIRGVRPQLQGLSSTASTEAYWVFAGASCSNVGR